MNARKYNAMFERLELELILADAKAGSHAGQCDNDIQDLRKVPYIKRQLEKLSPRLVREELAEYGAWDETELTNHETNLDRVLWLACCTVREEYAP